MIIGNSHLKHYCGLHKAAQEYIMQSLKEEWNFETIQLHTYGHTHTTHILNPSPKQSKPSCTVVTLATKPRSLTVYS